jgi:anti-anti-sigma regulatory factor
VGSSTSALVITVKPPEQGAPRAIEPKGSIDAGGADLLMRVFQFVSRKSGQRAVVDFSGVTAISSEAQHALEDQLPERAAGTHA